MELFGRRLGRRAGGDVQARLAALEDYVEYLRQQGEYGLGLAGRRLDALDGGKNGRERARNGR